jgi:hypothetical protein
MLIEDLINSCHVIKSSINIPPLIYFIKSSINIPLLICFIKFPSNVITTFVLSVLFRLRLLKFGLNLIYLGFGLDRFHFISLKLILPVAESK